MKLLGALGLGTLAVMLWLASLSAAGHQPGEAAEALCLQHAPGDWYEAVDARAEVSTVPPRVRCELVNTRTGERAAWSSGNESVPPFWLGTAAGAGALGLVAWAGADRFRGRRRADAVPDRA